jgi:hypothetical protein
MDVLKWERDNGCAWDSYTCAFAVGKGHLELFKWARQNGCPWDSDTFTWAAHGGTQVGEGERLSVEFGYMRMGCGRRPPGCAPVGERE